METVYKLVKRVDDKLVSIRTGGLAKVEYKIGEWSEAPAWLKEKGYDLCILENIDTAIMVQHTFEKDSIILECEAENIHTADQPYLSVSHLSEGEIHGWEHAEWPSLCTVMAERVRPIKELS